MRKETKNETTLGCASSDITLTIELKKTLAVPKLFVRY